MTKAIAPTDEHAAHPHRVSNSTRVMVALPFSTFHLDDSHGAVQVAELLARVCRAVADGVPAEELRELATEAEDLAATLSKH